MFPGGKGDRCVGLTILPPSCAVVMKSGNLNLLEISGPLQACKGIVLAIYIIITAICFDTFVSSSGSFAKLRSFYVLKSIKITHGTYINIADAPFSAVLPTCKTLQRGVNYKNQQQCIYTKKQDRHN